MLDNEQKSLINQLMCRRAWPFLSASLLTAFGLLFCVFGASVVLWFSGSSQVLELAPLDLGSYSMLFSSAAVIWTTEVQKDSLPKWFIWYGQVAVATLVMMGSGMVMGDAMQNHADSYLILRTCAGALSIFLASLYAGLAKAGWGS